MNFTKRSCSNRATPVGGRCKPAFAAVRIWGGGVHAGLCDPDRAWRRCSGAMPGCGAATPPSSSRPRARDRKPARHALRARLRSRRAGGRDRLLVRHGLTRLPRLRDQPAGRGVDRAAGRRAASPARPAFPWALSRCWRCIRLTLRRAIADREIAILRTPRIAHA